MHEGEEHTIFRGIAETNDHLLTCPTTARARKEIWEQMIQTIVEYKTKRETALFSEEHRKKREDKHFRSWGETYEDQVKRRLQKWQYTHEEWEEITTQADRDIRKYEHDVICPQADIFSFNDIGRGITPKILITILEAAYLTPKDIKSCVLKIFRQITEGVRNKIWKVRCEETAKWEKRNGMQKTHGNGKTQTRTTYGIKRKKQQNDEENPSKRHKHQDSPHGGGPERTIPQGTKRKRKTYNTAKTDKQLTTHNKQSKQRAKVIIMYRNSLKQGESLRVKGIIRIKDGITKFNDYDGFCKPQNTKDKQKPGYIIRKENQQRLKKEERKKEMEQKLDALYNYKQTHAILEHQRQLWEAYKERKINGKDKNTNLRGEKINYKPP